MATAQVTSRQQTVLDGLKAKKTPQTIAAEMGISVNGVYGHVRRLKKVGLVPGGSKRKSAPRAGGRRRATSTRQRASRNGRPTSQSAVVKAIRKANAEADKRLAQIEGEMVKLISERDAIEQARTAR